MDSLYEEKQVVRVTGGGRGVIDRIHAQAIPDDAWASLVNCDLSIQGEIRRRKGRAVPSFLTSDLGDYRVHGLGHYRKEGQNAVLLAVANATLYSSDGSSDWASIGAVQTAAAAAEIFQAGNLAFVCTEGENVRTYDGSSITAEDSTNNAKAPKSRFGIYAGAGLNRVFLSGNTAAPTYLYFSDVIAPTTYNQTSNVFKFGEGSGQKVTGLAHFRNFEVIVFLDRSIEVLIVDGATPLTDWKRRVIDPKIGCCSHGTVQAVGEDIFFMDQDGNIRSLNRTIQDASQGAVSIPLSYPIQATIDGLNKEQFSQAKAVVKGNMYLVTVAGGGASVPDTVLVYDIPQGIWCGTWTGLDASCFALSDIATDTQFKLYIGQATAGGKVWEGLTGYTDAGTAISLEAISKMFDFGMPEVDKLFCDLECRNVATAAESITVEAQIEATGYNNVGTYDMLGTSPTLPVDLPFYLQSEGDSFGKFHLESLLRGRNCQLKFTNADDATEIRFKGFTLTAFPENYELE